MKPFYKRLMIMLTVASLSLLPLAANATSLIFQGLQTDPATISPESIAIGENQFKVEITADPSLTNYVDFKITNIPTIGTFQTSSITEAYFWDGSIFTGNYQIDQSSGVNFIAGGVAVAGTFASVAGLPTTSLAFTFDGFGSTPPTSHNGVDSTSEYVILRLEVNPANSQSALDTVLAAIEQWGGPGTTWNENTMLAMGVKGQAYEENLTSADFVAVPTGGFIPIPVPPSALLLGSGLLGLGLFGWRRREK
jgi:hypothetical protein